MKPIFLCAAIAILFTGTTNAQNVGIGTTTPGAKLTVAGGIASTPVSAPAAASVTIPNNTSIFYLTAVAGSRTDALTMSGPTPGQFLTIYNLDGNPATFAGYTIPATTGLMSFKYINGAWQAESDNSFIGSGNYIKNGTSQQASSNFNISGNGVIGGTATVQSLSTAGIVTNTAAGLLGTTAIVPAANGGTGVNNTGTLTNAGNTTITGGGTLGLGGYTLTVPATGTAAEGTGTATYNAFWSATNTLSSEQYTATSRGGLGANMTAAAVGAIPYSTSTTAYGTLASVAAGSVLVSGGVGVAPAWQSSTGTGVQGFWTRSGSLLYNTNQSDNVGIGTTNPGSKLQVAGGGIQDLIVGNAGSVQQILIGNGSGYSSIQAILQGTAYNSLALNANGGNVGIGTSAPGYLLDIYKNSSAIADIGLTSGNSGTGSSSVQRIQFSDWWAGAKTTSEIVYDFYGSYYSNASHGMNLLSGRSGFANFWFRNATGTIMGGFMDQAYGTAPTLSGAYNFLVGGNVGIGTAAPQMPLDVIGTQYLRDNATLSSVVSGMKLVATGGINYFELAGAGMATGTSAPLYFTSMNAANIWMTLTAAGHLGIGTTSAPLAGIGAAMFAIHGTTSSTAGPHVQYTTSQDNYPVYQQLNWAHDNIAMNFDAYYDGTWKYGHTSVPFSIYKTGGALNFEYANAGTAGNALTWIKGISISGGNLLIGDNSNNLNPYILPAGGSTYARLGSSSQPFQDVHSNYFYAHGEVRVGGTSSPVAPLDVEATVTGSSVVSPNAYLGYFNNSGSSYSGGILLNLANGQTNGDRYFEFESGGSEQGCLYGGCGGNCGGVSVYSASDRRLKTNIRDTRMGIETIMKMKIRDYEWIKTGLTANAGFIAQELYEVYPDVVVKGNDTKIDSLNGGTWMVNYAGLTPLIIKGMQDQQHLIESQQAEIAQLRKENERLKSSTASKEEVEKLKASIESLQQIIGSRAQK